MGPTLTVLHNESTGRYHLGNPDRDNPEVAFDKPGKLLGCLRSSREFEAALSRRNQFLDFGLNPITVRNSDRIPDLQSLLKVHPKAYIQRLFAAGLKAQLNKANDLDPYDHEFGQEAAVSEGTYLAALTAVGCAYDCIDIVLQDPKQVSFSIAWPPGHHAEKNLAMGFCYLSTAALAGVFARDHAVQRRAGHQNRVVIIDIDNHRGNGTADAVANMDDIYLIDLVYKSSYDEVKQQYTDGELQPDGTYSNSAKEYPPTRDDAYIPVHAHPVTNASNIFTHEFLGVQTPEYLVSYYIEKVLPQLKDINPDVIIWSLGLDSAQGDVLGGLGHIPGSFYTLLAGTRLAFAEASHIAIQEGGYDEKNWSRILQPCLLAMHPQASTGHSKFFQRYAGRFIL